MMKPQTALRLSRPAWPAVLALFLLPLAGVKLSAQQSQPWPTDDMDNGQYSGPQPGYGQQQYASSQYNQPQYPQQQRYLQQQAYPQQSYAPSNQPYAQSGYQQSQGLNAEQLEQLVAPIALYPDNLLAQVLAASTYPAQIAAADQWRRTQGNAPNEQIAAGADAQSGWDPSVKALTAFPQVLAEMDRNLQWTTDLGNAYYNQPDDVMQTVQVMRDRAQAAGNLQSTPQEQMNVDQGNIELGPADPQTVYVPSYNPWGVYGQPVSPYPGFSLLDTVSSFLGSSPIQFGLGIAMQAFASTPWGWLGWGLDWLSHAVLFNHDSYFSRSNSVADWGFPHGGPRASRGWGDTARYGNGNGWGRGNFPRPRPEFSRGEGRVFNGQGERFRNGRIAEGTNRGWQSQGNTYGRPFMPHESVNRMPEAYARSQQYEGRSQFLESRPQSFAGRESQFGRGGYGYGQGYGSGYYTRQAENYGARSGMAYANPAYHTPQLGNRGGFESRQFSGYGSNSGNQGRSGGFHLFGHNRESQGFSGGGRGSGSFNYGGQPSGGFGGGWKAPKAPHFSSGSHFGGGGHFGGSHHSSGGGHSGGHGKHN
jgi:hypothetical protein